MGGLTKIEMTFNVPHADCNKAGVYVIRNSIDGRVYVGATKELRRRFSTHQQRLKCGTHPNPGLQAFVNHHSIGALSFDLICLCEPHELLATEQFYLDFYQSYQEDLGFNRAALAGTTKGIIFTAESRAKISLNSRNRSPETRAKLSKAAKNEALSAETRAKRSAAATGKTISAETRAKISESEKGKVVSIESRAKMSAAQTGKTKSPEIKAKISAAAKARAATPEAKATFVEKMQQGREAKRNQA